MDVDEPVVRAIFGNDLQGLKQALDQGYSANMYLDNGTTPIHAAIKYGDRYECVKILLSHPTANINAVSRDEGATALLSACVKEQHDTVELLVNHPDCDINLPDIKGWSPLHIACFNANTSIIQLLVSHGCLVDIKDYEGFTPLHAMMFTKHEDISTDRIDNIVSYLLAHGADPSIKICDGCNPFHFACENGFLVCAKLLHSSSNVPLINQCNNFGESPLMMATTSKNILIVNYLLSEGADANITDKIGLTALQYACIEGDIEILLLLLQHCTVLQPEDLLEWLNNFSILTSNKVVETLFSLSPYYRLSQSLLPFHLLSNIEQEMRAPLNRVHSLASHCRSVIRRSLNKEARSTLSVFRTELLNLNLPELLVRYLRYSN